ncbi:hypothetical protein [Fructilactobacillus florum]|uniref:hypothetical protein n=1 Tax=Fructilactobacillus florum TaxID=640331 RepID=UPI002093330B|nr:hypothetical protein [Fructilactobacillus florum]
MVRKRPAVQVKWLTIIIIVLVGGVAWLFTRYNASFYQQTVAQVEQVHNGHREKNYR